MSNTTSISVPVKGMNTDVHPANLTEQGYDFALNSVAEGFDGNGFPLLQNESSTLPCINFPNNYKVIGVTNITEQDRKILFLVNPTTGFGQIGEIIGKKDCDEKLIDKDNQLGYCDSCGDGYFPESNPLEKQNITGCCEYFPIATQSCFNFNENNPIKTVYRLEDCGISIYFTDKLNSLRYIEFEYVNDDASKNLKVKDKFKVITGFDEECEAPIYGSLIDCNKLLIDPVLQIPDIEYQDVASGGRLRAGVYQFLFAYADINGDKRTPYFHATNPIPIFTRDVTFDTDYLTDRSIKVNVENISINTPYEYYNIAVAKTINNVTSFELLGTFPVTNKTIVYTGNDDTLKKLTPNEIFERKVYYSTAKNIGTSNDYLFWSGLEETKKLNLQPVANKIKLYWQTMAVPEYIYKDPRYTAKFKGYMRDEVYAFAFVAEYDNGEESAPFPIPGREATLSDLEFVDNDDSPKENDCSECADTPTEEVQLTIESLNTTICTLTDTPITLVLDNSEQSTDCPDTPYSDPGCFPFTASGVPPFVNAGVDQTLNYYGAAPLNGIATQGSGFITSTTWQQISGPNQININNPGILNTYFDGFVNGVYVIQLCVTDTLLNTSIDNVQFTMNIPVNQPPIADPGADKIVTLPISISYLNGAQSSDDDSIVSYVWSQVSGPNTATIVNNLSSYTNVIGLIEGTYEFKLVVTDTRGCSSEATTKIYVLPDPSTEPLPCANLLYPINGSITSSFTTVVLDWDDVDYATNYDVYLRTDAGIFALIGNALVSNFTVTSLLPNTIYHWYVVPKNSTITATGCDACYRSFVTPTQSSVDNCIKRRWEVYNTASVVGGNLEPFKDCEETCYQYGEFAYWESTDRYPNRPEIWGDLCNKPIRHHKFPDSLVTHIHDGDSAALDYNRYNIMYPIGVKVDYQSVRDAIALAVTNGIITEEDAARIVGYKIVRGNRFQNKSIVAKGLLFDVNQYQRKSGGTNFDDQPVYFANYPYNDLRTNPFITDDFRNYEDHNHERGADLPFIFSNRYTFHSPDTHFTQPSIGTKIKLETVEYGLSEGYFNICKNQARQKFLSTTSYTIAFAMGIIATLIKKDEKDVKEYTVKGSIVSGMGLASGILGPFLPYQTGTGAAIVPESILDTILNPSKTASINAATEVTTRTIQGKEADWINPIYLATKKPFLLPIYPIMLANYISGFLTSVLTEAKVITDLIESLTPYRDWTTQFQSVGKYNSYKTVPNSGNKIRAISSYSYLKSENTFISERSETNPNQYSSVRINNWSRESSLYLKYLGVPFPNAGTASGITDESRYDLENTSVGGTLNKKVYKQISSYYASIKNYVPDQYGSIFNIDFISTGAETIPLNLSNGTCRTIYGGDTFINRFALKIKVPYFLADTFGIANGTDFNFADYTNLAIPRHYYNSSAGIATEFDNIGDILSLVTPDGIADLLGRPKSIRDAKTNKFFYQNGYIYLYHYGIPYFLVESDVNVDYRYAENLKEKAFYPIQSDLDYWMQQENVPIKEDNYYLYNNTYSKQNKEHAYIQYPINFDPGRMCRVAHPNRLIYSNGANWLTYKANDYKDFDLENGKIIGTDGLENGRVLVRFENTYQVFNAYITIPTSTENIQVGTGGMFQSRPQEFARTTLGHGGSQHTNILHTEFGHIWVDAKRGQVFNLNGNNLDEISRDGMKNWFKENLPFQIVKDFPSIIPEDIDNNFKGIGIALSFDKRFNRFILTKLDYKLLDSSVTYNTETKQFMKDDEVVSVKNKKLFCNKSWTISYNFFTKSWISFHSYIPNYYVDSIDYFTSGLNDDISSSWLHNATNKSYQVFYNKINPWIVQSITKADINKNNLNAVEFALDAIRYHNEHDPFYTNDITFNKAIISTQNQNTGLLNLEYNTKNNLKKLISYPIVNATSTTIRVTNAYGIWRFNQFYDLVQSRGNNIPIWLNNCANSDKSLNPIAINYQTPELNKKRISGEWCKVRLINDKETNYKMIFKWIVNNSTKADR
jgi:hypothetical protein